MQLSILQRLFVVAWLFLAVVACIPGPAAAVSKWQDDEADRARWARTSLFADMLPTSGEKAVTFDELIPRKGHGAELPPGFVVDKVIPPPTRAESYGRMLTASREAGLIAMGVVFLLAVPLAALQFVCLGSPLPAASWRPRVRRSV